MDEIQKHLYVLILAGGGGTRLWPMSRDTISKQFLKLFGQRSLLQMTYDRAKLITAPQNIWIATTADQLPLIRRQLPKFPPANFSIEPMRRNTAWGQGLAAVYILKRDPDAVIINLASDHLITGLADYKKSLTAAVLAAHETRKIITVGIDPTHLHLGYEYINMGKKVARYNDVPVYEVKGFIKRSEVEKIRGVLTSKTGLWNANNYTWRADSLLGEYKKLEPKIYSGLMRIHEAVGTDKENQVKQAVFQMAKSTQIDFIFTGRSKNLLTIRGEFSWTDVGDWSVVWAKSPKDTLGNVIAGPRGRGQYVGVDSKNNLLFLEKKLIATAGLENMVVVDTKDVLLICPKDDAQSVKKIVEILKDQKLLKYL